MFADRLLADRRPDFRLCGAAAALVVCLVTGCDRAPQRSMPENPPANAARMARLLLDAPADVGLIAGQRRKIDGVIHGASGSGQTLS